MLGDGILSNTDTFTEDGGYGIMEIICVGVVVVSVVVVLSVVVVVMTGVIVEICVAIVPVVAIKLYSPDGCIDTIGVNIVEVI